MGSGGRWRVNTSLTNKTRPFKVEKQMTYVARWRGTVVKEEEPELPGHQP